MFHTTKLIGGFWIALLLTAVSFALPTAVAAAVDDPLPRITCTDGYNATIYAESLNGPDGLAFHPLTGQVVVAEEGAGRVSAIPLAGGAATSLITGLSNPEGIAYDAAGNLYIVEDVASGRLIQYTSAGATNVLETGLLYPEGVTVGSNGFVYLTESAIETWAGSSDPNDFFNAEAYVSSVDPNTPNSYTRLATATPSISGGPTDFTGSFDSFSGITQGGDGLLYVSNEASGVVTSQSAPPFTLTFTTNRSLFTVDPVATGYTLFATGLTTVEGVRFSNGGAFPLYAVEEDTSGAADSNTGRISKVASDGSHTPFCTGFFDVEDILVASDGTMYVSEDTSGLVVKLSTDPLAVTLGQQSAGRSPISLMFLLTLATILLLLTAVSYRKLPYTT